MSELYGPEVGYQRITATGQIGDVGKAIALYGYVFKSSGSAGNPTFSNGKASSKTDVFDATGTANATTVVSLGAAVTFPDGLYITVDGNTAYVVAIYRQVLT